MQEPTLPAHNNHSNPQNLKYNNPNPSPSPIHTSPIHTSNSSLNSVQIQKAQLIHDCLLFQHRKQKYLYGMTYLLVGSSFLNKNKVDYFIVPSRPYVNEIYLWAALSYILDNSQETIKNNPTLNKLKKCQFIICNQKQLKKHYPNYGFPLTTALKQHQLTENYLIDIHRKLQIQNLVSPILSNQSDQELSSTNLVDWLNSPVHELKIIVPQKGTSTYLCQGTDIIAIDPSQQFVFYLQNNYIMKSVAALKNVGNQPGKYKIQSKSQNLLSLLKTVIVTKPSSVMALLGLLTVGNIDTIKVLVTSSFIEQSIIESSRKYLSYPQQLTRSRLLIRCLDNTARYALLPPSSPFTLPTSALNCTFYPLSEFTPPYLQIQFGSSIQITSNKKIIFYTPSSSFARQLQPETEMKHFPYFLKEEKVQFVCLYRVGEALMAELKELPQPLRKKIILNRSQHKYNHKYFLTFETNKIQHCTITDTQYLQQVSINKRSTFQISSIFEQVKYKQIMELNMDKCKSGKYIVVKKQNLASGWRLYQMGHMAEIQVGGQVVHLIEGILQVFEIGDSIGRVFVGRGNKGEIFRNVEKVRSLKYAQVRIILELDYQIYQLPLISLSNFISSPLSTIPQNSLLNRLSNLQLQILSSLCQSVTYEVGLKTNNNNEYIYFISKGGLKWQDSDEVAGNGFFIGDLLSYYAIKQQGEGKFQFDNYIEVIKDTWAVLVRIEEFDRFFLCRFPDLLDFIYRKGNNFH